MDEKCPLEITESLKYPLKLVILLLKLINSNEQTMLFKQIVNNIHSISIASVIGSEMVETKQEPTSFK